MSDSTVRVLLDANILISYLLTHRPDSAPTAIIYAALRRRITLLLPDELFVEVRRRVASKPYLRVRIVPQDIERLAAILREAGEVVAPLSGQLPEVGRDRKDDYLLACAHRDGADYLVTRDKDLLDLAPGACPFVIAGPAEFLHRARQIGLDV